MRRLAALTLVLGLVVACGPSPDEEALALCSRVPDGRAAINALHERVPQTIDFNVVSGYLMEIYDITEFLQDWAYIETDELNGPVRTSARSALASTGMYGDGTNPITGAELVDNLRTAQRQWDQLDAACGDLEAS